eukprot:TRINITY_DN5566_c0_g3_i1.p1 TRINITY_DN5566_c0_g3~~TRINITY_DN5566_c0_g3_i1.p1  ORF type:complete len:456 (+),score=117.05 TRINITY_DN5566_c0_g3_i1:78-1370(+)
MAHELPDTLSETAYLRLNPGSEIRWNFDDISGLPYDVKQYGPVDLRCQMYVEDIPHIHTAEESFRIVIDVSWEWVDDRILERNPGKPIDAVNAWRIHPGMKEEMWLPKLEVINAVEIEEEQQALEALIRNGRPKIVQGMKYSITAKSHMLLHNFPFDIQRLQLIVRSSVWPKRDMEFSLEPSQTLSVRNDFEPSVALNEFTMERAFLKLGEHTYPMTAILEGEEAGLFSEWRFCLDVRRRPNHYLFKIVYPFFLIIVLNALSMMCDATDIATRMSTSITLFLTSVAFQLVVSGDMPKIAYSTRLDYVMGILYAIISTSIFFNMSMFRKTKEKTNEELVSADRTMFALYITTCCGLLLWFLRPLAYPQAIDDLDLRDHFTPAAARPTIRIGALHISRPQLPNFRMPRPIRPDTAPQQRGSTPLIAPDQQQP